MFDIILNGILWTLALYGLIEIIKTVYYICTYTNLKTDGIYVMIAVKNQEEKVEGFIRSVLFKYIYGKEECIKDIIIVDLNSQDKTMEILERLQKNYSTIKCTNWRKCKQIMDNIDEN